MRTYLYCLFLLFFSVLNAQEQKHIVDHFSIKEGLYHNYVSKIVSDSLNIKWIATENGINKYDGYKFSVIEPSQQYPELKNENIETLFIDSKNNLWIGTKSGGLSKLEITTNTLTNYNAILERNGKETLRIREISEDNDGNIWIGSHDNGLFVLDDSEQKIVKYYKNIRAKSILKDKNGAIWVAAQNVLNRYNTLDNRVYTVSFEDYISKIVYDQYRNCIWVNTNNENKDKNLKLHKFEIDTEKNTLLRTNIKSNYASALYIDKHQKLWVGTWGQGLYSSNSEITNFSKQRLTTYDEKSIDNYEIILDIHADKNDVLWVGTSIGGVVKLTEGKGFMNADTIIIDEELERAINIHSIYKDTDGIYVGTLKSGLFFGENLSQLKQLGIAENEKIQSITNHNNSIVVGANTNTLFLDKNKKLISKIDISKATCFLSESDAILWVGTQKNGVYKVDVSNLREPKIITQYNIIDKNNKIESNRITALNYDTAGNIWLGTYNGLHLLDKQTEQFIHYKYLTKNDLPNIINTIHTDINYIWVGTPKGLFKLTYSNQSIKILDVYTTEHGLFNDFICGITSDNHRNLWITTTTNLVSFDPSNNSFINYTKDDGVHTSLFNLRSIHSSDNQSLIYAGGIDNITYFDANKIKNYANPKELIFTHLKIDNKNIQARDSVNGSQFLETDINYATSLHFSHKEKSFSLGFINDDFSGLATTNYRYKLEGYDKDWNYLKNQNEVNFVGLPAGSYDLQVSSSKDFQNWTPPKSLKIKVDHAPFSSPFAYVMYSIIGALLIFGFLRVYFKQKFLRNELQLSELAKEKEHELNEAKLTFFTNISHEFRTPLTLILGPIKELLTSKNLQNETAEKILTVEKNASRLLNLTNELLDFRKAEHGLLKLSTVNGNFVRFSNEVFMYFKEQANSKKIEFNFICQEDAIEFPFDRNKMEIVICNLISNALKYTNEGGKIDISLKTNENHCIFSIKDTGLGIEPEYRKKIFDRFFQIKNTKTAQVIGTGIGLSFSKKIIELHKGTIDVESKLNEGTTFTFKLPYQKNMLTEFDKKKQSINSENIENYIKLNTENLSLNTKKTNHENTVLIVDDNEDIRTYLKSLLHSEYNIIEACDGEEGVIIASQKIPDLILCDIMMPKKDGLTACKELKSQVVTSHIPIIMLTARSSNMYEIEGLETGADDFISKPFDPQIIKARISSALQNRLKLREHFLNFVRFEPSTKEEDILDPEGIFLNKAITLIEENLLDDNFGIKTLMTELHMSQSTLYRKIKSLTGLSLTGFIRSIRLKKSAEIILTEDNKLSYVAMKVGFNDYKYFRESFKKQFGCLPSEYKKLFSKTV